MEPTNDNEMCLVYNAVSKLSERFCTVIRERHRLINTVVLSS
jgi:hypothetical protein